MIYLKDWVTEREKEIFHPLGHSLKSHNDWSLARLKPGTRSFFSVFFMGAGAHAFEPSPPLSKVHWQEAGSDVKQSDLPLEPMWDAGETGSGFDR